MCLNLGSRRQCHTTAQRFQFTDAKDLGEILTGSPETGTSNRGGVGYGRRLLTNISSHYIPETVDIITMER